MKEFQALGLDISILTKDGMKDLKELESIEDKEDIPVSIEEVDTSKDTEEFTTSLEDEVEDYYDDDEESEDFELDDLSDEDYEEDMEECD